MLTQQLMMVLSINKIMLQIVVIFQSWTIKYAKLIWYSRHYCRLNDLQTDHYRKIFEIFQNTFLKNQPDKNWILLQYYGTQDYSLKKFQEFQQWYSNDSDNIYTVFKDLMNTNINDPIVTSKKKKKNVSLICLEMTDLSNPNITDGGSRP